MMRLNSITIKLMGAISAIFIIAGISVLLIADRQMNHIIDKSQTALYGEKVETIRDLLKRNNERLNKTGLVDAYIDDFKQSSVKTLRRIYYKDPGQTIYPFIISDSGRVIMHPKLAPGDPDLVRTEVGRRLLNAAAGDFDYTWHGEKKWCLFKRFTPWGWIIAYTVPLKVKYADAHRFHTMFIVTKVGISLLALLALTIMVTRFIRPIVRLTNIATAMAAGDLDQDITPVGGNDEIGRLARSFSYMRDAVRRTISDLKQENLERQKAEARLAERNNYINSLLESLTHSLYAIDVNDYSIKMANSASGIKSGGRGRCYELTHQRATPCRGSAHPCPLEIIKKTGKPTMVEHVHYDGSGEARNIEVYAYPVFDRNGELAQMIEYGIDVTEQKKAQRDLAAEKERLSVTLRSIGDGVITTDTAGRIILLNRVAEKLTGFTAGEAKGRPLSEVFKIINAHSREACENPVAKVIENGQVVGMANHTVLVAKDGSEHSIADSGAPILDARSNIIGVVLVFRDVSAQLKTEQELLKITKLESIGVLAGGIAHDFNNILAAILGNINLALYDQGLEEKTRALLAGAEKASLRARDLTQQLLTFAKGGEPVKEVASLEGVIRDSAGFVLHGDAVACHYHIPDDLWLVDIDQGQISQVVQNIVLNASHAMPGGGTIDISCENIDAIRDVLPFAMAGRYVKIAITDIGIGIPARVLEKIFDPYFTTKQEGSGLGLAISQSIISKHGGHITAESSSGNGSTFTIYLPAADEARDHGGQETAAATTAPEGAKIMIMDDDEMVREVVTAMLGRMGHEAATAVNGEEAIKLYREAMDADKNFDLIIMDLTIPGGMGGKEAAREVLKLDPEARIIVSSGYSNDPIMADYAGHGFAGAIVKPYQSQELARAIGEILKD